MEYVLTAKGLCKKYKKSKALDNLTMNVPKGSIYGFVGRNGAGKTTLIRIICGLQFPNNGEFTLYGVKNTDRNICKSRQKMGAVVETPSIYADMTAEKNLEHQCRITGVPSFDCVKEILELVGLSDTGRKKAKNFSLGMRQRLSIAMALVSNPDFLVLDEPINGLDPEGIIETRELILKLNRERGTTILISSHILDELSRLATHFGFINNGHMVKELSAEELENACRKYTHIKVSDTKILASVLDDMQTEYKIISENTADIYADIKVTPLVLALDKKGCEVISMSQKDESLESYFISLVGGENNE